MKIPVVSTTTNNPFKRITKLRFMTLIIVLIFFVVLAFFLKWLFETKIVHEQAFWWDTWNGLRYSRATLYKFKRLPFYYISHDDCYRHPKEHPEYKRFLERVYWIKKARKLTPQKQTNEV